MNSGKQIVLGGVAAIVGGLACVGSAYAQPTQRGPVPGAVGQPDVRQERVDERSVIARESENYDPKGVAIGSFKLFPELELDEVFNDNIYAAAPAFPRQGAFIQQIKPT